MIHQTPKQTDVLADSLRNLHSRLHLHNDLLLRWLGSLQLVTQIKQVFQDGNRDWLLVS